MCIFQTRNKYCDCDYCLDKRVVKDVNFALPIVVVFNKELFQDIIHPDISSRFLFTLKSTPHKSYLKRTLGQILKISPLTPQIYDSAGVRGGPQIIFLMAILIFLLVRGPCKIWEPYDNSLLEI